MVGQWVYQRVKKSLRICSLVSIKYTNVTDGRTPHDGIVALYITLRDNKDVSGFQQLVGDFRCIRGRYCL